jgi:hypothetical protein
LVSNVWVRVWVWFSMFAFGKIAVNELLEEWWIHVLANWRPFVRFAQIQGIVFKFRSKSKWKEYGPKFKLLFRICCILLIKSAFEWCL